MSFWDHLAFVAVVNTTLCQLVAFFCTVKLGRSLPQSEERRLAKAGLLVFAYGGMLFLLMTVALRWPAVTQEFFHSLADVGGPWLFAFFTAFTLLWLYQLDFYRRMFALEATSPDAVIQGWSRFDTPFGFLGACGLVLIFTSATVWYGLYRGHFGGVPLALLLVNQQFALGVTPFGLAVRICPEGLHTGVFRIPFSQIQRAEYARIDGPQGPYVLSCWLIRWKPILYSRRIRLYGVSESNKAALESQVGT